MNKNIVARLADRVGKMFRRKQNIQQQSGNYSIAGEDIEDIVRLEESNPPKPTSVEDVARELANSIREKNKEDKETTRVLLNYLEEIVKEKYGLTVDRQTIFGFSEKQEYVISQGCIFIIPSGECVSPETFAQELADNIREKTASHFHPAKPQSEEQILAPYRSAYQRGVDAFQSGDLAAARGMLEPFRKTSDCPHGTYLLGTVVAQLYPDNTGAQKFGRYLIGKARTIDEEIEAKMKPIMKQGE